MKSLMAVCIVSLVGLFAPNHSVAAIESPYDSSFVIDPGECIWACGEIYWSLSIVSDNLRSHYIGLCSGDPVCIDSVNEEYDELNGYLRGDWIECSFSCLMEAPPY